MSLAGGHDVSINAVQYDLAADADSYLHLAKKRDGGDPSIPGRPGDIQLTESLRVWAEDDWTGGEGLLWFSPDKPTQYYRGSGNPRNKGYVTSQPARTDVTLAPVLGTANTSFLAYAGGSAYVVADQKMWYSTDFAAWTAQSLTPGALTDQITLVSANEYITAAVGDHNYVYIATKDGSGSQPRYIKYWDGSDLKYFLVAGMFGSATFPLGGLATLGPYLVVWNGYKFFAWDRTQAIPAGGIAAAGANTLANATRFTGNPDSMPTSYDQDCIAADEMVIAFTAYADKTIVYTLKTEVDAATAASSSTAVLQFVGRKAWTPPNGFRGRCATWYLGKYWIAGTHGSKACMYVYDPHTEGSAFVGYIRPESSLTPTAIGPGPGAQILIGCGTSDIFIYDASAAAFSYLDSPTSLNRPEALSTYGGRRVGVFRNTTTVYTPRWQEDDNPDTTSAGAWNVESPAWDFGLPEEDKIMLGYSTLTDTLSATKTLTLSHCVNEVGGPPTFTYTALTTLTSSTSGRNDVLLGNSAVTFRSLRFKAAGAYGAKLYLLAVRVYVPSFDEYWELKLDLTNEGPRNRAMASARRGETLAANLWTAYRLKTPVTFLDGVDTTNPGTSNSYSVILESLEVTIGKPGSNRPNSGVRGGAEGVAQVRLRRVS